MRVTVFLTTLLVIALTTLCVAPGQADAGDVWVRQAPTFVRGVAEGRTLTDESFEYKYTVAAENKEYSNKITFKAPPEQLVEGQQYTLEVESSSNPGADIFGSWHMPGDAFTKSAGVSSAVSNPKHRLESPHFGKFTFTWAGTPSRPLNAPQPEVPVKICFVAASATYETWAVQWNYKLVPAPPPPAKPSKPAPKPEPPKNPFANARPLTVTINLDSYSQSLADQTAIRGEVTVQAPESVKPGWQVTVTVICGPDVSAEEASQLLTSLGSGTFDEAHSELQKIGWGGGARKRTFTLDGQRRATGSLERDFAMTLPGVPAGAPPRPAMLLAFASLGKSYYGEAQAAFEITNDRKGTAFISLQTDPNPAVGGQTARLTLTCDVRGLAKGVRTVPVNAEGRLKWLSAPQDQWIDGRRNDGSTFKAPPMIPLLAQREPAQARDADPTCARATITWTVSLPGPGDYLAALDIAPVGFDFLQREVAFNAVAPPPSAPPANPNQGRPTAPQPEEGQHIVAPEAPADAPPGTTNLALGMPADQCCAVEARTANFGVDGVKQVNNEFRAGVRDCTKPGRPYWVVDLKQVADISEVRLYNWNINEHQAGYAKWIEVWFATTPTNAYQVYARAEPPENDVWGMDGKPLIIDLKRLPPSRRQARYVTLRNPGDPPLDINLVEVEVYGRYVGQPPAAPQPPAGDGARREAGGGGGAVSTFGPLKLQIRDGKVVLPSGVDLLEDLKLPPGSRLLSIEGTAVQATTAQALSDLLKPYRNRMAIMCFGLPDGTEAVIPIMDDAEHLPPAADAP